ncbi:aldo/keto reductase [Streptomyces azureus]|uniref:Aldo/keto reductase n=1 Tax=Streptomyces azureus TaxID=146537 RepID=A0A0K8PC60_STRAJ|nr:aldo/keto reductase [Streptomyces azureus]
MLPWSPHARGRVTRDWDTTTERSATASFGSSLYQEGDRTIVEAVTRIAGERGCLVPRSPSPGCSTRTR